MEENDMGGGETREDGAERCVEFASRPYRRLLF